MGYIKKFIYAYYNLINRIFFSLLNVKHGTFEIKGIIFIKNRGKIEIGNDFRATSSKYINPIGGDTLLRIITDKNGYIKIGNNVGITNCTINCWEKITIDDHVYIGGSVKIWDSNFHSLDPIIRTSGCDTDIQKKAIHIKSYAFIGADSIILKGVTIGEGSIIGAGSIVTKSVPNYEVWAGNPARFVKKVNRS